MAEILYPADRPNHHAIGQCFKGDGVLWYCDSYQDNLGYWLTPIYGEKRSFSGSVPKRINISTSAVDRTFHTIYFDFGRPHCRHWLDDKEVEFILAWKENHND